MGRPIQPNRGACPSVTTSSVHKGWSNSLLIVTFDEDDDNQGNQIFTVFYGQSVKAGSYSEHITHYSVLRTLENMYGPGPALAPL